MYARTTQLEIDTVRVSVESALELFQAEVLPRLASSQGSVGSRS